MKKAASKKPSKKRVSKSATSKVIIDKKLNALSGKILFPKKLEKANRILAKVGVPA